MSVSPDEANTPAWRTHLRQAGGHLNTILGSIVVLMLTAIVVLIILQIVMRAVVQSSLVWTSELASALLVWSVCLGIALAFRKRAHIVVDVVISRLSPRLRIAGDRLGDVLSITLMVILALVGAQVAMATMGQITPALRMPMGFVYLALPVGAALSILNIVLSVLFPEPAPTSPLEAD